MLYNISFLFYRIFFFNSRIKKNGEITAMIDIANFLHDIFLLYQRRIKVKITSTNLINILFIIRLIVLGFLIFLNCYIHVIVS